MQVRISVLPTLNEKGDIVGISQPLLLFVQDPILVARGDEAMGAQVMHIVLCLEVFLRTACGDSLLRLTRDDACMDLHVSARNSCERVHIA
jgi:hypothetical protein